jgi:DNA modification methylase
MSWNIRHGDCREVMRTLDPESVDSIVSDPPYGLSFMGKGWDHGVPGVEFWTEALRVAKPGAHLLAFGGTRTYHRLACAIEDAGWEIRDCVMWVYGSGFPKSHDVSKAIDKAAGAKSRSEGVCGSLHGCGPLASPRGRSTRPPVRTWAATTQRRPASQPS